MEMWIISQVGRAEEMSAGMHAFALFVVDKASIRWRAFFPSFFLAPRQRRVVVPLYQANKGDSSCRRGKKPLLSAVLGQRSFLSSHSSHPFCAQSGTLLREISTAFFFLLGELLSGWQKVLFLPSFTSNGDEERLSVKLLHSTLSEKPRQKTKRRKWTLHEILFLLSQT